MARPSGVNKLLIAVVALIVIFIPPFAKYQELRYKNKKMEERIKNLEAESRRLAEEKRRLETDITYIEQKAREKMGVVRKGEIVIREASGQPTKK